MANLLSAPHLGETVAGAWTHSESGQAFMTAHAARQAEALQQQADALLRVNTAEADAVVLRAARMRAIAPALGSL